ncbi:MAG: SPOR domain-containing protein [Bacteroidales bacterium]|nr:SPOR domain-containing protein [Bacteroidales bacterium]
MFLNLSGFLALLFVFSFIIPTVPVAAQDEYSEISVFIEVHHVGGSEVSAIIKGNEIFLSVPELFDFLKIKNSPDKELENVTGSFINPEATYTISRSEKQIRYQDKVINLAPGDIIRTESNFYLKSNYFGSVFGLDCNFSFRSLSVQVDSKVELPMIREMRLEEMRKNMSRLKGEVKADTTIGRSYPLFKFGMADWSAIATEEVDGKSEARLNLALGAMVAGGEATANLYYNSQDRFNEKQQHYLWRYVNNDFAALRQVMAGKISANAISTLYNPVIGVQFTNTPTTYRRSFGSYTLSDRTEPGWIVELYVNNVMVDFVKADASGFFTFQVPMVYGNSSVKLKFYGPWGEERIREQHISIPFNFLPVKTLEYTASAGIVEDTLRSRFSRANVNYGLTKSITIGGGVEYLSSISERPAMPFINTSVRITNNLLLSAEYSYKVRTKGTLTYQLPSSMQFDLYYSLYDKNQKAINFNYREERKAVFSTPLRIGKFSSYQRFSVYQIVLPDFRYTTGEWLFSGSVSGINTNLTTYALFMDKNTPNVYSTLSMAFRLPAQFVLMPQVQAGYTRQEIISAKLGIEKRLMEHAFINLSFEQYFNNNVRFAELGFKYDFSFAQTGVSVRQSDKRTSFVQYARGSLINDSKTGYLGTDNRTNVGKGGISISAFIDINGNGIKDKGEPRAYGLNLHAGGGRIERSDRDSTIRILGLEPYTNCFVELDPNSFENISWRLPVHSLNITVDPNILKNIEIPITVSGEATGKVLLEKDNMITGQGRIIMDFYTSGNKPAGKTITENDGYYSLFGLTPGKYTVRIDTAQLRKLGMKSYPESQQFNLAAGTDGDVISGLDFTLRMLKADTVEVSVKPFIRKDTTYMIIHEITQELVTIEKDSYAIQLGAFKVKGNAEKLRKKLEALLGKKVEIVVEDGFFKVRIPDLADRAEVNKDLALLQQAGITEVWIISKLAKQKQWILREIKDSLSMVTERVIEKPFMITSPRKSIQIGAFTDESRAKFLQKEISASVKNEVVIVHQNGYYKVRVIGFNSDDEMKDFLPELATINLHNTRIRPVKKPVVIVPEVRQPVIEPPVTEKHLFEIPPFVAPDTTLKKTEILRDTTEAEIKTAPAKKLTISLQVGVYYKESKARKAQRKITSKLHLQVEIVKKWDYYRVMVVGFKTREETYKYYPELAGIGYPGITLIEEYK